jgi:hypothetical protein
MAMGLMRMARPAVEMAAGTETAVATEMAAAARTKAA